MIKWLSKFETSKIITYIFIGFYLIFLSISAFVKAKWGIDLTQFIEYLQPILMTIIVGYFTKSGIENYTNIKTTSQETIQANIQESNAVNNDSTVTETLPTDTTIQG